MPGDDLRAPQGGKPGVLPVGIVVWGSGLLVALGALAMAVVLGFFPWTTAVAEPWSFAVIVVFVVGSWVTQIVLIRPPA
ncbi:hypothetical protein [Reyranella sp.]